jgi:hypothetical protein
MGLCFFRTKIDIKLNLREIKLKTYKRIITKMRISRSEPTIKPVRHNIGNGYGQYCVLDDTPIVPTVPSKSSYKIKINIVTPNSSDIELSESESSKSDKKQTTENTKPKIFIVIVYVTTALVIAFEYWYCFKR